MDDPFRRFAAMFRRVVLTGRMQKSEWVVDGWNQRARGTPEHQLLLEVTMGEWRPAPPRARAVITFRLLTYLGVLDQYRDSPNRAHEWLKNKENAREDAARQSD